MFIKAQYQWESFNLWNGSLNKRCFKINANIYPSLSLPVLVYQSVDKLHFSCEEGFKQIPDSSVCAFHLSHASLFWQAVTQHCFIIIIIFIIIVIIIMLSLFSGAKKWRVHTWLCLSRPSVRLHIIWAVLGLSLLLYLSYYSHRQVNLKG